MLLRRVERQKETVDIQQLLILHYPMNVRTMSQLGSSLCIQFTLGIRKTMLVMLPSNYWRE